MLIFFLRERELKKQICKYSWLQGLHSQHCRNNGDCERGWSFVCPRWRPGIFSSHCFSSTIPHAAWTLSWGSTGASSWRFVCLKQITTNMASSNSLWSIVWLLIHARTHIKNGSLAARPCTHGCLLQLCPGHGSWLCLYVLIPMFLTQRTCNHNYRQCSWYIISNQKIQ